MLLIYGANGYTGELCAREAVARGLRPVVAGRDAEAVGRLAEELRVEHRVFGLADAARGVDGARVVLSCAGPFAHTASAMVEACLRARAHYLDVTGEFDVIEAIAARDEAARAAGVMLMPAVGFDVVPSDCLAAHLARRLPSATRLALALSAAANLSRGTVTGMVEYLPRPGCVRRGGVLVDVPAAHRTRDIDFGDGPRRAVTIPWGDLATAYRTTGIPDIEVYAAVPRAAPFAMRALRGVTPLLAARPLQAALKAIVRARPPGPSADERARGQAHLWGEVEDADGRRATARLRTPEAYTLTSWTSIEIAARALAGGAAAPAGFRTPAGVHGPDFILAFPGVARTDG